MKIVFFVLGFVLVGCGALVAPDNACATPARVVPCDDQNFYVFSLVSDDGGAPTWLGSQCRTRACVTGDACEIQGADGVFVEGVCK